MRQPYEAPPPAEAFGSFDPCADAGGTEVCAEPRRWRGPLITVKEEPKGSESGYDADTDPALVAPLKRLQVLKERHQLWAKGRRQEKRARLDETFNPSEDEIRRAKVADNKRRLEAVTKVILPGAEGVAFRNNFDIEDDEAVDAYCRKAGGFWGKLAPKSICGEELLQMKAEGLVRGCTNMWFSWDSSGNVFFEEEGPKTGSCEGKVPAGQMAEWQHQEDKVWKT